MCGIVFEIGLFLIGVYTLAKGEFQFQLVYCSRRVTGTRVLPIGLLLMGPLVFGVGSGYTLRLFAGPGGPDMAIYNVITFFEWVLMIVCPISAVAIAAMIGQEVDGESAETEHVSEARPSGASPSSSPEPRTNGEPDTSGSTPGAEWRCPACGETVPGDFDVCWNCQQVH